MFKNKVILIFLSSINLIYGDDIKTFMHQKGYIFINSEEQSCYVNSSREGLNILKDREVIVPDIDMEKKTEQNCVRYNFVSNGNFLKFKEEDKKQAFLNSYYESADELILKEIPSCYKLSLVFNPNEKINFEELFKEARKKQISVLKVFKEFRI